MSKRKLKSPEYHQIHRGGRGNKQIKTQQNRRKGILNIPLLRDRRRRSLSEGLVSETAGEKLCLALCPSGIRSVHP